MEYTVFDADGTIIKWGRCPKRDLFLQAKKNQFVVEGAADDAKYRVRFEMSAGMPVNVRFVDKITGQEKPPKKLPKPEPKPQVPRERQPAFISKGKWEKLLRRVDALEKAMNDKT